MPTAPFDRRAVLAGVLGSGAALAFGGPSLAAAAAPRVAIRTGRGLIVVELEARRAPLTSANFLRYVDARQYDGGAFYRSTRRPEAPTQGTIVGRPGPKSHPFAPIAHESTTQTGLRHLAGTLSLGRFAPGSATSNFFICASDEPYLDAHPGAKGDNLGFAAFGRVVQGMAVVQRILQARTSRRSAFPDQRGQWLDPPMPILGMTRKA